MQNQSKGVDHMSEVLDNLFETMYGERLKLAEQRGISLGEDLGEQKAKKEAALSLSAIGLTTEQIAQVLKKDIATVQGWISENSSAY